MRNTDIVRLELSHDGWLAALLCEVPSRLVADEPAKSAASQFQQRASQASRKPGEAPRPGAGCGARSVVAGHQIARTTPGLHTALASCVT